MKVIIAGLGVQGRKRKAICGDEFVAYVDPFNDEADYKHIQDVPLGDYDSNVLTPDNRDFDNNGVEEDSDVEWWLLTQGDLATHYDQEWIFNIADMVTTEGEIDNDGTKLFQVRFYPYFE